jgi:putative hemolysin
LLGSVPDEFKTRRLVPLRLSDGRVRLPGDLPLEGVRVWFRSAWPSENLAVADFIVREAGRLPEPGEKIQVRGLEVEIESVESDRILSLIVGRPHEKENGGNDEDTA